MTLAQIIYLIVALAILAGCFAVAISFFVEAARELDDHSLPRRRPANHYDMRGDC